MFTRGASEPAPGQEPDRPAPHAHGGTHLHSHDLGSAGAGVRTVRTSPSGTLAPATISEIAPASGSIASTVPARYCSAAIASPSARTASSWIR